MAAERITVRKIAFAAVVAGVYATLTMINPIGYGPVQFRFSEVLCILPFFFPMSVWGLFVGCVVANLISAYGIIDIVFGSLATLLAALCTMAIGKKSKGGILSKALACAPPVVFNALIVGALIAFYSTNATPAFWPQFLFNALFVGLGELVVLYALGLPALAFLPKTAFF
jgi:uncharacterized membrane protein